MSEPSFYIGYMKKTPPDLAAFNRRIILALGVLVLAVSAGAALLQGKFEKAQFEFGKVRACEGVMYQLPVPTLHTPKGEIILVGPGKHGIPDNLHEVDAKKVRFNGTLLYWQDMTMLEITEPESFAVVGEPAPEELRAASEVIGPGTFDGEIVDTKCFFGAMRPGHGKVHRACAIRCLSGGVPPGILVRHEDGSSVVFLLRDRDGGPLKFDIQWTARPVRIKGILEMQDGLPVLRAEDVSLLTKKENP